MTRWQWQLNWAKENRLFWLSIAILPVSMTALAWATSDFQVRVVATCLVLIGVSTVWWDLHSAARKAARPSMWKSG